MNLDPINEQAGWTDLDLDKLGISTDENFIAEDLLTGVQYPWRGRRNFVALRPGVQPAHVLRIIRQR